MPNGTYGGVRGRKTKVGGKLILRFPPTRLCNLYILHVCSQKNCFLSILRIYLCRKTNEGIILST